MYVQLYVNNVNTKLEIDLHILPIKKRIKYEICLLAHKAIQRLEPYTSPNCLNFGSHQLQIYEIIMTHGSL